MPPGLVTVAAAAGIAGIIAYQVLRKLIFRPWTSPRPASDYHQSAGGEGGPGGAK